METREELLKEVLLLIEKYKITAYEVEQNTDLTAVGVQKIINRETKKPLVSTLKTIKNYIYNKHINNNTISGNNHRINQGGIYKEKQEESSITSELINLLHTKDKQIAKKDEQIDKLLHILSNNQK
ncbi:hypothetical protein CAPN002_00330 [Capnocytophaga stomatis]|uniref:hypothetical protein n=1 Tax=Capnocytophaga stomatis TaxID=1848904 RepID=UPI00194DF44D|nr:hypothetical protein [Capnocytophaga stomatis]GIJ92815.1 hypothetical protein CAPN002_00330 [Capnocytophaga stomatis]